MGTAQGTPNSRTRRSSATRDIAFKESEYSVRYNNDDETVSLDTSIKLKGNAVEELVNDVAVMRKNDTK